MSHVPPWVFVVLVALVMLGLIQSRPRIASRGKVLTMPLIIVVVSLSGIFQVFGLRLAAIAGWLVGVAVAIASRRLIGFSARATFSPSRAVFMIQGSWLPLALLMGIFALRFAATAGLARHPELADHLLYETLIGLGQGLFSGAFIARSLLILGKAYGPDKAIIE